jgi:hypothetical protein
MGCAGRFKPGARPATTKARAAIMERLEMVDQNQSPPAPLQTESTRQKKSEAKADVHHSSHDHTYDAPGISPREFLIRVMRDHNASIRDRMKAASTLLRLFGNDGFGRPRLTIVIGGIPDQEDHSYPSGGKNSDQQSFSASASHSSTAHDGHTPAPNIETVIEDINSGNIPEPTLCMRCGHYMPYPCVKAPLN